MLQEGLKIAMRPKAAVHIMKVKFPINVINEFNLHIDKVLISANVNAADRLQPIPLNIKSCPAQLTINHNDKGVGKQFSDVLLKLGETYMEKVTGIKSKTAMETMWSVHSYEGDYNPIHDHGTKTPMGLSCILYLKVPPQIEKLDNHSEEFSLHSFSGVVDGFTYLSWGVNGIKDINMLRPITEEYIKPVTGTMLMFPSWLRHGVMPFFGEGERRTFSANMSVVPDSKISGDHYRKHTPEV